MKWFLPILLIFLSVGCSSDRLIIKQSNKLIDDQLSITDIRKIEKRLRSKDVSPDHKVKIGEELYLNKLDFDLDKSVKYERLDGKLIQTVDYFFSTKDKIVRAMLFDWKVNSLPSYKTEKEHLEEIRIFDRKYKSLIQMISGKVGKPSFINIESDKFPAYDPEKIDSIDDLILDGSEEDSSWKDQYKWKTDNSLTYYLMMFGDYQTGYRKIRLVTYAK